MSRGVGTGNGVWFDGYSFHGKGIEKDPRHAHDVVHPRYRSVVDDVRRSLHGGFGWTSSWDRRRRVANERTTTTMTTKSAGDDDGASEEKHFRLRPRIDAAATTKCHSNHVTARIRAVYREHVPEKSDTEVDVILEKFKGRETWLLPKVKAKYVRTKTDRDTQKNIK